MDGGEAAAGFELSAGQKGRLKDIVMAALLMHALHDVNLRLGFIGLGSGEAVHGVGTHARARAHTHTHGDPPP